MQTQGSHAARTNLQPRRIYPFWRSMAVPGDAFIPHAGFMAARVSPTVPATVKLFLVFYRVNNKVKEDAVTPGLTSAAGRLDKRASKPRMVALAHLTNAKLLSLCAHTRPAYQVRTPT